MLDDLLAAYPDASVIVSHRDPARTMPSTVSTTAMVQWMRTDDVPVDLLAQLIGAVFTDALNAVAVRRDDGSLPGRYGDVRFADLMADPVAAIDAAYEQLGRPLTDDHRRAVLGYLEAKPRGKHGTHAYTAADWGFDVDDRPPRPGPLPRAFRGPARTVTGRRRARATVEPAKGAYEVVAAREST